MGGDATGTIGIVGAGPCGLYVARLLAGVAREIQIFESEARPGGRARMGSYEGTPVVGGAGVVRNRDRLLRGLARESGVPLSRFKTRIQPCSDTPLPDLLREIYANLHKMDRRASFRKNIETVFGSEFLRAFRESAGATDYLDADVIDTVLDYGFQDNTPGQVMFGINWDDLIDRMVEALPSNVRLHLETPVDSVRRVNGGQILLNHRWRVDAVVWTAPRPSWPLLTPLMEVGRRGLWRRVMRGVSCQSFLRAYARPELPLKAQEMYPYMTYLPSSNPIQKILPYRDGVYMISYSDNRCADTVARRVEDRQWLHRHTGLFWTDPVVYYFRCGTHFYRPLDPSWSDRDAFLRDAQNPSPGVYLCSEGLSRNQGWTEGALESARRIATILSKTFKSKE